MNQTNIKTRIEKNNAFTEKIAKICKCTPRHVRYVLTGKRGNRRMTALAEKILLAVTLYEEKNEQAWTEIELAVNSIKAAA